MRGAVSPHADAGASVLDDLIDPVNHARDMPAELKQKGPEHLEHGPSLMRTARNGRKRHRMTNRTFTIRAVVALSL